MPEVDKEVLLLQLADWDPTRKLKVRRSLDRDCLLSFLGVWAQSDKGLS